MPDSILSLLSHSCNHRMETPLGIIIHNPAWFDNLGADRGTYECKTCRTLAEVGTVPTGFSGSGASVFGPARPGKQLVSRLHTARYCGIQTVRLSGRRRRTPGVAVRRRGSGLASAPDLFRELLEGFLPEDPWPAIASSTDPGRCNRTRQVSGLVCTHPGELRELFRRAASARHLAAAGRAPKGEAQFYPGGSREELGDSEAASSAQPKIRRVPWIRRDRGLLHRGNARANPERVRLARTGFPGVLLCVFRRGFQRSVVAAPEPAPSGGRSTAQRA